MTKLRKKLASYPEIDYLFLLIVFATVCVGLVMLQSASGPAGKTLFDDSYHFFTRQLGTACFGFALMAILSYFDYHNYAIWAKRIYIAGALALIAVLLFGENLQGAKRWIQLPGFQLQPSEMVKPALAIYLAYVVMSGKCKLKRFNTDLLPFVIPFAIYALLMLLEPHVSGTIILFSIALAIYVCSDSNLKYIWIAFALGVGLGVPGLYLLSPLRWGRVMTFFNPFADAQGEGYQVVQSVSAIGSGGIFGRGLGQSLQKYGALPEPYNDFIFAVICEELGLIGGLLVILLFCALIFKAIQISLKAPDTFGRLVGIGITTQVAVQVLFNIAVATSSCPNTGISLPFFSYGGTSIIMLLAEMGILLNISRQSKGLTKKVKKQSRKKAS